ncbi:HPP family protein [Ralstonia soli]|uniref:HPP family protein n=1 Tax=Ralstonia soli TaxID=2953896 RepID=A0ABT1AF31_9RALS|nr:HPP family protein [Ralstonia soli]MCO5396918.1 HPP family protein [Ralstonia soli]
MSEPSLHPALRRWLHSFIPAPVTVRWSERVRSAVGALVGILFTGTMMKLVPGAATLIPLLVAPMGASAVLLFAVPASPLAQPWSIIGGNLVAATVGVTCAWLVKDPVMASALAVSIAIVGMFALRCVHPPSGAVALTAVIGGPAVHALGYRFVLEPILIQSALLLMGALVYHAATGHRYPHAQRLPAAERAPTTGGFTRADIVAALRRQSELLDIDPEDIEAVLREMQLQAYTRTFQALTCADIMSSPVVAVTPNTSIPRALQLLRQHSFKALPVVNERQHVIGIVTRADLLGLTPRDLRQTLRHWFSIGTPTPPRVAHHMKTHVRTIRADAPMSELVPLFASAGHHHIPVVDAEHTLVGILTESDLVGGLYRQANIEPHAA